MGFPQLGVEGDASEHCVRRRFYCIGRNILSFVRRLANVVTVGMRACDWAQLGRMGVNSSMAVVELAVSPVYR